MVVGIVLGDVSQSTKAIVECGMRNPSKLVAGDRSHVTVVGGGSAAGASIPPLYIFAGIASQSGALHVWSSELHHIFDYYWISCICVVLRTKQGSARRPAGVRASRLKSDRLGKRLGYF